MKLKRILVIVLVVAIVATTAFAAVGCGSAENNNSSVSSDEKTFSVKSTKPASKVVIEDNEDFKFTIKSVDEDGEYGYTIHCVIENKTDKDMFYAWDGVSVNNMAIDPFWSTMVPAEKTMDAEVCFNTNDLVANDIEVVEEIAFVLDVCDSEEFNTVFNKTFIYNP